MRSLIFFICLLVFVSCESKPKRAALELLEYGLPISVDAPEGSVIEMDDLGVMKDVTIKSGDDYFVQIFSSTATNTDAKGIMGKLKDEVKKEPFFSKLIEENEQGFIYEKKLAEENIDYDFRFVKVQGDTEYIFQTGLYGKFTVDQVKEMYKSVQ